MEKEYQAPEYHNEHESYSPRLRLAEAYIPYQRYGRIFNPREALEKGTLFPELYRPYHKRKGV